MFNILVLCTGNSARSIMLEGILNAQTEGRLRAFSAGSKPTGTPHPVAIMTMSENGIDPNFARSKSWDEFGQPTAPLMDLVVTVCDSAAGETCPVWPGTPLRTHWGLDDPAAASEVDQVRAFSDAFDLLKKRASAFIKLEPWDTDHEDLQNQIDMIGQIT